MYLYRPKITFAFCITVGIEHKLRLQCCGYEAISVTMARARIWPSSPSNPHLGFSSDLLHWAKALLLECQVALKDLCSVLSYKCPHLHIKVF